MDVKILDTGDFIQDEFIPPDNTKSSLPDPEDSNIEVIIFLSIQSLLTFSGFTAAYILCLQSIGGPMVASDGSCTLLEFHLVCHFRYAYQWQRLFAI